MAPGVYCEGTQEECANGNEIYSAGPLTINCAGFDDQDCGNADVAFGNLDIECASGPNVICFNGDEEFALM